MLEIKLFKYRFHLTDFNNFPEFDQNKITTVQQNSFKRIYILFQLSMIHILLYINFTISNVYIACVQSTGEEN